MSNTIYKNQTNIAFTIDKTYDNKAAMKTDNSVYPGRFVMIKYCDSALDYITRRDIEETAENSQKWVGSKNGEQDYYINFWKDGGKKSYDRFIFKRGISDWEEIACLHPINNGGYENQIINSQNLNIENGAAGERSLQQKGGAMSQGQSAFSGNLGDAIGAYSAAFGYNTHTPTKDQFACGRLNKHDNNAMFMVGNGEPGALNNAFTVYKTGGAAVGTVSKIKGYDVSGLSQTHSSGDKTYVTIENAPEKIKIGKQEAIIQQNGEDNYVFSVTIEKEESGNILVYLDQLNETDKVLFILDDEASDVYPLGEDSLGVGKLNEIIGANSQAVGTSNKIRSNNAFAAGSLNFIEGNAADVSALGTGLKTTQSKSGAVIGRYNEGADAEFIIGCGSGDNNRKNSLVSQNGLLYAPQMTDFSKINEDSLLITRKILIDIAHPVGSYYWSSEETEPSELFPGTSWEQIKDKFVLAVGDKYSITDKKDEDTIVIPEESLPKHVHKGNTGIGLLSGSMRIVGAVGTLQGPNQMPGYGSTSNFIDLPSSAEEYPGKNHCHSFTTNSSGESKPFVAMPPYITAYCWRRVS